MLHRIGLFAMLMIFTASRAAAINAQVSHTLFYAKVAGSMRPEVEISWQVRPQSLHFSTTPEKTIVARIRTDIYLITDTGILLQNHFAVQTPPRNTVDELATLSVVDMRRYPVPLKGNIQIKVILTDLADSTHPYLYADSFSVENNTLSPVITRPQLLDTAYTSSGQDLFTKYGQEQIPFSSDFVDDPHTVLHFYSELYQTDLVPKRDFPLIRKVSISKKEYEAAYGKFATTDTIKRAADIVPLYGSFPIRTLPSGNYYLNITLENSAQKVLATNTLFFQRMNLHPATEELKKDLAKLDSGMENITVLDLDKTFVHKYSLAEIKAILKMLLPVVDPVGAATINNFQKKPDEMYMRYFVYNYFSAINKKDPAKAWKEYSDRVIVCKKLYSAHGVPGYETERGRIFLRYGKPTDIVTVLNESGALPYEIWQYNSLRQMNGKEIPDAMFLFYKQYDLMGDFVLLHSNVAGEALNMSWRSYLYQNGQGINSGMSTAETYMGNK